MIQISFLVHCIEQQCTGFEMNCPGFKFEKTLDDCLLTVASVSSSAELHRVVDKLVEPCELLRTECDMCQVPGHVSESDPADARFFLHVFPWPHTSLTPFTSVGLRKKWKDPSNFPAHLIIHFSPFNRSQQTGYKQKGRLHSMSSCCCVIPNGSYDTVSQESQPSSPQNYFRKRPEDTISALVSSVD